MTCDIWDTDYISDHCEPEFNLCNLTVKSDTGQHSQFLQYFKEGFPNGRHPKDERNWDSLM